MKLTGRVKFTSTWTGKVILMVEYFFISLSLASDDLIAVTRWRYAKPKDIALLPSKLDVVTSLTGGP